MENAWEFLAEQVARKLQPVGRAAALASTLRQIGVHVESVGLRLTLPQLRGALDRIGDKYSRLQNVPPDRVAAFEARAATVREMAALLPPGDDTSSNALLAWAYVGACWPGDDPRDEAIRATWSREARWL